MFIPVQNAENNFCIKGHHQIQNALHVFRNERFIKKIYMKKKMINLIIMKEDMYANYVEKNISLKKIYQRKYFVQKNILWNGGQIGKSMIQNIAKNYQKPLNVLWLKGKLNPG